MELSEETNQKETSQDVLVFNTDGTPSENLENEVVTIIFTWRATPNLAQLEDIIPELITTRGLNKDTNYKKSIQPNVIAFYEGLCDVICKIAPSCKENSSNSLSMDTKEYGSCCGSVWSGCTSGSLPVKLLAITINCKEMVKSFELKETLLLFISQYYHISIKGLYFGSYYDRAEELLFQHYGNNITDNNGGCTIL
jgi:hypothetical protein